MTGKQKVVVAMSGGVDSSVAAALLVEQGYEVIGMMLRLWNEPGKEDSNQCCTPDAMAQARRVAAKLGIPFYAIDAKEIFYQTVVQSFIAGYTQGVTPNPCLVCNRLVRWDFLLKYAMNFGADYLATGHYVRINHTLDGKSALYRGIDSAKDQSYVLSVLNQEQLSHSMFPIGSIQKSQVREIAQKFGLSVASRKDSQDLCFLAGQDYREFLNRYAPHTLVKGEILSTTGKYLGQHEGLGQYTIGQRKGLNIPSAVPLYVIAKDTQNNRLVVGDASELGENRLIAGDVNWISGVIPTDVIRAEVKIRYKAAFSPAKIRPLEDNKVEVIFDQELRDITPGQRAVFYQGDLVLGGGTIEKGYK